MTLQEQNSAKVGGLEELKARMQTATPSTPTQVEDSLHVYAVESCCVQLKPGEEGTVPRDSPLNWMWTLESEFPRIFKSFVELKRRVHYNA